MCADKKIECICTHHKLPRLCKSYRDRCPPSSGRLIATLHMMTCELTMRSHRPPYGSPPASSDTPATISKGRPRMSRFPYFCHFQSNLVTFPTAAHPAGKKHSYSSLPEVDRPNRASRSPQSSPVTDGQTRDRQVGEQVAVLPAPVHHCFLWSVFTRHRRWLNLQPAPKALTFLSFLRLSASGVNCCSYR